jgi:guanidinopropionase
LADSAAGPVEGIIVNKPISNPQPVDAAVTPRFGAIPTFMRLPHVADPASVDIALIGVPWDGGTTNRAGARHGPREIRNMSSFMRKVHHVSRLAPYQLARIADVGDSPCNPIDLMASLEKIEKFFAKIHAAGVAPLSAGGDHLITLPIFRAIAKNRPVGMVHFDAHSDTNDRYFGDNKYTHGTPFRRAVEEGLLDPKRTVQIGIRGSIYYPDDMKFAEDHGMRVIYMEEFSRIGPEKVIKETRRVVGSGPTYISFDVDGLDPVYAPGTGTPEIGGITTREAQQVLRGLQGVNLVGGDVVEVSPPFDPSGNTALVGATMMFEIMCILADAVARRRKRAAR